MNAARINKRSRTSSLSLVCGIFCLSLLTACGDDDPVTGGDIRDPARLTLATGLQLTDANAQALETLGNPNDFGELTTFPNPATTTLAVQITTTPPMDEIWVVTVARDTTYGAIDMPAIFANFQGYTETQLSQQGQRIDLGDGSLTAQIDMRYFTPGYYRIISIDEGDNQRASTIYVDPQASSTQELLDRVRADW